LSNLKKSGTEMHATEREKLILSAVSKTGFVTYRDLEAQLEASPATIRRDLTRLEEEGQIERVHGGAKLATGARRPFRCAPIWPSCTSRC
jgi:DeoR family ulaG and ulaABCDEF operon transcriptional repressor